MIDHLQESVDGVKLGLKEATSTQHAERLLDYEDFIIALSLHNGVEFDTEYVIIAIDPRI